LEEARVQQTGVSTAPEPLIGGRGQRQVQLPFRKAFAIALQSIRVRFWRSMITAAGVLLGIAFLGATFSQMIIASHTPVTNVAGLSEAARRIQEQEQTMRQWWLVSMSLIVCAVGIANSMLMSVTERFKEIGTMKCLGALDGFIVKLFLLEAGFLGIIASVIGFLVGFIGAVLVQLVQVGPKVWERLPPGEVLFYFVISMVAGTVLTVLATIFPSMQAAKLPPAAALRSEI
jgi:predicted lysophospholipase L1 biosynthesis ABC-type transport system permease subunit